MIIIRDTREKEPWDFSKFTECKGQFSKALKAGDYTIKGKETLITIDRKKTVGELASNLGMQRVRFENELQRMQKHQRRYILCEFPYEKLVKFPIGSGLPAFVRRKIRAKGKFLVKQVQRMSEKYEVEFIFCTDREEAQAKAMELFKEVLHGDKEDASS